MRKRTTTCLGIAALALLAPSCMTGWALSEPDRDLYRSAKEHERAEARRRALLPFALIGDVLTFPFLLEELLEESRGEDEGGC